MNAHANSIQPFSSAKSADTAPWSTLIPISFLCLLSMGLLALGFWTIHPFLALGNSDGAMYYTLGKAMVEGHGYLLMSQPEPQPYFTFPVFFSLQISGLMMLFQTTAPESIIPILKSYELGIFAVILGLFYRIMRQQAEMPLAMLLTVLLALSGTIHRYLPWVLSDVPYLLTNLIAVLAFIQADKQTGRGWWITGLVCLALSIMTRHIGIALGLAVILRYLLTKDWKKVLVVCLVCGLSFGGWIASEHLYRSSHPIEDEGVSRYLEKSPLKLEYLKRFLVLNTDQDDKLKVAQGPLAFLKESAHRTEQYSRMIATDFFPSGKPFPKALTGVWIVLTLGFLGFGLARLFPVYPLIPLYMGLYMGVLCNYPYVSPRFLIPMVPFFIGCFFIGLLALLQRLHFSQRKALGVSLVLALMACSVQWQEAFPLWQQQARMKVLGGPITSQNTEGLYTTYGWIHDHLPADSIVYTRKAEIFNFYTGLRAKRFPFFEDSKLLKGWFAGQQSHYAGRQLFILEESLFKESKKYLTPMVQAYPKGLQLLYEEPQTHTRVWKLVSSF